MKKVFPYVYVSVFMFMSLVSVIVPIRLIIYGFTHISLSFISFLNDMKVDLIIYGVAVILYLVCRIISIFDRN